MKKRENSLFFALMGLLLLGGQSAQAASAAEMNKVAEEKANHTTASLIASSWTEVANSNTKAKSALSDQQTPANGKEEINIPICSICQQHLNNGNTTHTLSCSPHHIFHINCILAWYQTSDTCPLCKKSEKLVTAPKKIKDLSAEVEKLTSKLAAASSSSPVQSSSQSTTWSDLLPSKWLLFYIAHHWGQRDKRGQQLAYGLQVVDSVATVIPRAIKGESNVFKGGTWGAGKSVLKGLGTYGMYNAAAMFNNSIHGKPVKPEDFHAGISTFAKAMAATIIAERSYAFYKLSREEKKSLAYKTVLAGLGIGGIAYAVKKYGAAQLATTLKDVTSQVLSYVGNQAVDNIC